MFRKTKTCDDSRLLVLLNGIEGSQAFDEMADHVDGCERCQASLTNLAGGEEEWSDVRQFLKPRRGEEVSAASDVFNSNVDFTSDENGSSAHEDNADAFDFLAPPRHPEMLGRLGRYEIERHIGSGGMGIVFKAHDSELNRPVAIKVLAPHLASNSAARRRFAREAKAAAAVVHENVVAIHNVSSCEKLPYFVMQYIPGASLQARVDAEGPLDAKEVLRIGIQICAGLGAAHEQGLVHRDIKPCNILLENGVERVLLTDFGLARTVDDASVTRSGVVAGTPDYMSPEQANAEPVDQSSDLFSLGGVLYFMCTGHAPFRADRAMAVLKRICHGRHRHVMDINPDVPYELSAVIEQLLAKKPHERYRNAKQVQEALTGVLRRMQQGRLSVRRGRLGRLTRQRTFWRRVAATAILLGAVAVGLVVAFRGGADGHPAPSSAEQEAQLAQLQAATAFEQLDRVRAEQKAAASQTTPSDSNDVTEEHLRRVWLDVTGVPLGADSNSLSALGELSAELDRQGVAHREAGKLDEARAAFEKSLQIRQQLARTAPVSNSLRVQLGESYYNLGHLERTEGNADAAWENLQKALSLLEQCLQDDSANVAALMFLTETYRELGSIDAARGNRGSAYTYFEKSKVTHERLTAITKAGTEQQPSRERQPREHGGEQRQPPDEQAASALAKAKAEFAVAQERLDVALAEAELAFAQERLEKSEKLWKQGLVSESQLQDDKLEVARLRKELDVARAKQEAAAGGGQHTEADVLVTERYGKERSVTRRDAAAVGWTIDEETGIAHRLSIPKLTWSASETPTPTPTLTLEMRNIGERNDLFVSPVAEACALELDEVRYMHHPPKRTPERLSPGGVPIKVELSLKPKSDQWGHSDHWGRSELFQSEQPLRLTPGRHSVRVGFRVRSGEDRGPGKLLLRELKEIVTQPVVFEFATDAGIEGDRGSLQRQPPGEQAPSPVAEAEVKLAVAQERLEKTEQLWRQGLVTESQLKADKLEVASARKRVDIARAKQEAAAVGGQHTEPSASDTDRYGEERSVTRRNAAVVGWTIDEEAGIAHRLSIPKLTWSANEVPTLTLEIRNIGERNDLFVSPVAEACALELNEVRYMHHPPKRTPERLSPGGEPIKVELSLKPKSDQWGRAELFQSEQPLRLSPGKHSVRVGFRVRHGEDRGPGKLLLRELKEILTQPLVFEFATDATEPKPEPVLLTPKTISEHGYFMRGGLLFQYFMPGGLLIRPEKGRRQAQPTDIVGVYLRFGRLPGTSIEDLKRIGSISLVARDGAVQFHVPVNWIRDPVANRASIHGRFSAPRDLVPKLQLMFVGESDDGRKTYIADVKDFINAPVDTSNRERRAPQDVALGERGESIHIHMARSVDSKVVALLVANTMDSPRFEVEIRHRETGRLVRRIKARGSAVSMTFSPDGSHIEVKLIDGTSKTIDASTGVQLNSKGQRDSSEEEGEGTFGPTDERAVTPKSLSGANDKPAERFGGLDEDASGSSRKESPFDVIRRRDLRRLHHVTDSIDTGHLLRLTGKQGEVAIRAGETKLVELPTATMNVEWRLGDFKPETIDDTELFDFILVQWKEDGRVTWIKYQSRGVQLMSAEPGLPLNANGQRSATEEQGDGTLMPTDESAVAPKVSPVFYVILGVDRSVVHLARSVSFEPQAAVFRTLDGHTKSLPRAEVASVHVFSQVEAAAIDVIVLRNGEVHVGELLKANETHAVLRKPRGVEDGRQTFGGAEAPQLVPGTSGLLEEEGAQSLTIPNYEILHIIDNDSRQVAAKDGSGQAAAPNRKPMPAEGIYLGDEGYGGFEANTSGNRRRADGSSGDNVEAENSEEKDSARYQEKSFPLPPRRWAPRNPPIYVVRTHDGDVVVARSLELDAGSYAARLLDGTTKRIPNDDARSVHFFRQTGPEAVDVIVLKDGTVNIGELFDSNTRQIMLRGMDARQAGRRQSPWKGFSRNDILRIVDNATMFHDKFGGNNPSEF